MGFYHNNKKRVIVMDEIDYSVGFLSEWPWLHRPVDGLSSFDPHGPGRAL